MIPRFRCADIEVFPLGNGSSLVYSKASRAARTLSGKDLGLLRFCGAYRPLEEHAQEWCREQDFQGLQAISSAKLPKWLAKPVGALKTYADSRRDTLEVASDRLESVKTRLLEMSEAGFLVSDSGLISAREAARTEPAPPIATIGLTTRDRVQTLARALRSYAGNVSRYGRRNDFVVIDDSHDAEAERRVRDVLETLKSELAIEIRYAGRAEREAFARALVEASGLPSEVVHFALFGLPPCPVTTGAARNCLLLDTVGDRYVLVDDDSTCQVAPCPETRPGLTLTSLRDPMQFWFFPDRKSTLRAAQFTELDFLGLHERLLGRDVGDCLSGESNAPGELSTLSAAFDQRLRSFGGRVATTSAGIVGDSGIASTAYLFVDEASLGRLTASELDYLAAVESRQVLRAVPRLTISEGTQCMAGNLGLDNRFLLPPFVPVQRNSDGLFARTLRKCFRDSYQGYFPYALWHDPPQPRRQRLEDFWRDTSQIRFADVLIQLIFHAPDFSDEGPRGLVRLGAHLEDCASAPRPEFEELLRRCLWKSMSSVSMQAGASPDSVPLKDFYARYRDQYIAVLRESLPKEEYAIPRDLREVGGDDEIRVLTQQIVRKFGELLQAWPLMVQAAHDLRQRGVRLAVPV